MVAVVGRANSAGGLNCVEPCPEADELPWTAASLQSRVLVVDSQCLVSDALVTVLREDGCDAMVATSSSVLGGPRAARRDEVVVLGINPEDERSHLLSVIAHLQRRVGASVIAVVASTDDARLGECLAAGAAAVLPRVCMAVTLVRAVRALLAAAPALGTVERQHLLDAYHRATGIHRRVLETLASLTPREVEVLEALSAGQAAQEIALRSHTSLVTVRSHIRSILAKLGVHSQLQAVSMARQADWRRATISLHASARPLRGNGSRRRRNDRRVGPPLREDLRQSMARL